jgi:carbon-monoxide dehydrogenase medium subunit
VTSFDYLQPRSTDEAVGLLARHGDEAHLIAGGTSVVLMLRQELLQPAVLVGLRGIPGLRGIRVGDDGSLAIGATESLRTLERAPAIAAYSPALAQAIGHVATVRIRNQATIGGSLAHADPAQDPPSMLLALDAAVRTTGPDGEREIPLEELFVDLFLTSLAPAELITSIVLPPRPNDADAVYVKFLPGSKDDYATISVAVSGRHTDVGWRDLRIVCGAAGLTPLRIRTAEAALDGTRLEGNDVARAADIVAETVDPIDDLRGSADYKRAMAQVWARRALEQLAGRHRGGAVERP